MYLPPPWSALLRLPRAFLLRCWLVSLLCFLGFSSAHHAYLSFASPCPLLNLSVYPVRRVRRDMMTSQTSETRGDEEGPSRVEIKTTHSSPHAVQSYGLISYRGMKMEQRQSIKSMPPPANPIESTPPLQPPLRHITISSIRSQLPFFLFFSLLLLDLIISSFFVLVFPRACPPLLRPLRFLFSLALPRVPTVIVSLPVFSFQYFTSRRTAPRPFLPLRPCVSLFHLVSLRHLLPLFHCLPYYLSCFSPLFHRDT